MLSDAALKITRTLYLHSGYKQTVGINLSLNEIQLQQFPPKSNQKLASRILFIPVIYLYPAAWGTVEHSRHTFVRRPGNNNYRLYRRLCTWEIAPRGISISSHFLSPPVSRIYLYINVYPYTSGLQRASPLLLSSSLESEKVSRVGGSVTLLFI